MAGQTEDIPYNVSEFATPDKKEEQLDDDQPNKSVLLQFQKYLEEAIEEHNSLDVIDLTMPGDMNPTQQVAVHKLVVNHLRSVKTELDNKIKELR